jgi:hypothetical protein
MPSTVNLTTIKSAIKTSILDALVADGDLSLVVSDDFREGIEAKNINEYPAAIMSTAAVQSERLTNYDVLRTYTFPITIVMNGDSISGATEVEELVEKILNKIDENSTLGGASDGEINPSTTQPEAITSGDKSFIVFNVFIEARASNNVYN